jgi:hypothetical protein
MANIQPDRLTTCQSERTLVVSQQPSVLHLSQQGVPQFQRSYVRLILRYFE